MSRAQIAYAFQLVEDIKRVSKAAPGECVQVFSKIKDIMVVQSRMRSWLM